MKFLLLVPVLLSLSFCKSYAAVNCDIARQYMGSHTQAEAEAAAKAAGIVITKAQRAEYAHCFKKAKRKHRP